MSAATSAGDERVGLVIRTQGAVELSVEVKALTRFVQQRLRAVADPEKAGPMAAYMKTTMPFYGVQKPDRATIFKEMNKRFATDDRRVYERNVLALWALPRREEKYAALDYARGQKAMIGFDSMPLYERLIREGAWWDLVDIVAPDLVGPVLLARRRSVRPIMRKWIRDDDFWIRRAAIISQLRHKAETDEAELFRYCLRCADEREFFVRKAIGWALRQYSYAAPETVRAFLLEHRDRLSPLSYREGAKALVREGKMRR